MVVAPRATEGEAQAYGRGRLHAVHDVLNGVLFGDDAALGIDAVIAVEPCGDLLVERGIRSKSPAICSDANWSNGLLRLNASITQSRQRHM